MILFDRIVTILDEARQSIVRSVNSNMVRAYWLIGREIVEEVQRGEQRAEYGMQILKSLSERLNRQYGRGFSVPNLQNFRKFYLAFADRASPVEEAGDSPSDSIQHPSGTISSDDRQIWYPSGTKSEVILHPRCGDFTEFFSPRLSWSHYRALMRVDDVAVRDFYEREAIECGWSKAQLERQIHTSYYQRIVANQGQAGLTSGERQRLPGEPIPPQEILKTPYVLEFLGLPDPPELHESAFEQAIIDNLQAFLLELGRGFSFVGRQQHIRFDDDDFYIDLVFYNYILKCFLLIDLKIGRLTHHDIGQMDGYVRLYEDCYKVQGDNPTIGLILCSDRSEAVAKYSVLSEGKQIFASKYLQFLPSEEELRREIQKERRLIEAAIEDKRDIDEV